MPRPRPPYLHRERTRHGVVIWVVRRGHGARIRLRAVYDTPEFWAEYNAALQGTAAPDARKKTKPHTLAWALERYRSRSSWAALAPATRKQRENVFRKVVETAGDEPLSSIDHQTIREGRERRADRPHAANNFLKAMRGFFGWAKDESLVVDDPTKGVKLLAGRNDKLGFHTWTEDEIARFERRWPIGTRERLALDLLLYTGLRRGDLVRLGREHITKNAAGEALFVIRTEKTGEEAYPPLLPVLASTIDATPVGDGTFLTTKRGTPFVKESFGTWFRLACRAAGCPGSAHGLRKAGAIRVAENGASVPQLNALFAWRGSKMALHYIEAANKRRLARSAGEMLTSTKTKNEKRPHRVKGGGDNSDKKAKSMRCKSSGAQERTRTFTTVKPLAPEASASTNSATWAMGVT